ncbi:MAG: hypothetical protein E7436_08310 [Ruminococcaceae bacterium]|nr:hypothetical protein [Oscillospiraceae bacterium]
MDGYLRAIGLVLLSVVIAVLLGKHSKEMTVLLTLAVCAAVMTAAVRFLDPILSLLRELEAYCRLDSGYMQILLKAVGVGLVGEMAALVCVDGGHGAMGKAVEILTAAAVLWLSLPLMTALLELVLKIAGEL